ncbi:MAG: branched-chain amino acid ABC transporter [Candidatus Entotheonella factor]|uniref:Branched-chain amino acid ABC transporter n=1 Tax=Entotheonella factor TaxID=1429438 RepID=W4LKE4_ENTF1|nr:MAG: branched-chain amino acid ABC transporter [Candidatus Entotheonella factor]
MSESEKPCNVLELADVSAGYGATNVLERLSLALAPSESLSIIGRNGVGKTTLLATMMGHTDLHAGAIRLNGADISRLPVYQRARLGIAYVPQEREIFPSLTVRENLHMAARPGKWNEATVTDLFLNLRDRLQQPGGQLSGGEQQMLAVARALMANPSLLLMDEPCEGLAPVIVESLVEVLTELRQSEGLSIVLVEHNTRVALDFAARTVVMDRGQIVYDGSSEGLKQDAAQLERLIGVTQT